MNMKVNVPGCRWGRRVPRTRDNSVRAAKEPPIEKKNFDFLSHTQKKVLCSLFNTPMKGLRPVK